MRTILAGNRFRVFSLGGKRSWRLWMDTAYLATTILLAAMAAVRAGILLLKPTFTGHQR